MPTTATQVLLGATSWRKSLLIHCNASILCRADYGPGLVGGIQTSRITSWAFAALHAWLACCRASAEPTRWRVDQHFRDRSSDAGPVEAYQRETDLLDVQAHQAVAR